MKASQFLAAMNDTLPGGITLSPATREKDAAIMIARRVLKTNSPMTIAESFVVARQLLRALGLSENG